MRTPGQQLAYDYIYRQVLTRSRTRGQIIEHLRYYNTFRDRFPSLKASFFEWYFLDQIPAATIQTHPDLVNWTWQTYCKQPWLDALRDRRALTPLGQMMLAWGGILEAAGYWPPKVKGVRRWERKTCQIQNFYTASAPAYQAERRAQFEE